MAGQFAVEENIGTIPATMQAAVYRGMNDVRLETVPVPLVGAGELLLRVHTCGICGTDLKKIATGSTFRAAYFRSRTAGVVAAVGAGVHEFQPGDRVVVFHHVPCRDCFYCRRKTFAQCETYKNWVHRGDRSFRRRFRGICEGDGLDCPGRVQCEFRPTFRSNKRVSWSPSILHEGDRKARITARRKSCSDRSGSNRYHAERIG